MESNEKRFKIIAKERAEVIIENIKMKALLKCFKEQFTDSNNSLYVEMINSLKIKGL